jgi:hypothetical protein
MNSFGRTMFDEQTFLMSTMTLYSALTDRGWSTKNSTFNSTFKFFSNRTQFRLQQTFVLGYPWNYLFFLSKCHFILNQVIQVFRHAVHRWFYLRVNQLRSVPLRLLCFITLSLYNEILDLRVCSLRVANFRHKVVIKRNSLVQYAEVLFIFIQD